MQVFVHHIYEFEKGIRNLILHTIDKSFLDFVTTKLSKRKIAYKVYKIKNGRFNIFFGDPACTAVIEKIGKANLAEYTAEEDFILGIMLGYDRKKQCERFLNYKEKIEKMIF